MEIKEIEDFPGYFITKGGDVYSTMRGGFKKLTLQTDQHGYFVINLRNKCGRKTKKIHRLIAQAFIPNPHNLPVINHKNGVKKDNSLENLEWTTQPDNLRHAVQTGLMDNSGERGWSNKYTENQIRHACELLEEGILSFKEIAEVTEMPDYQIYSLKGRSVWSKVVNEYDIPEANPRRSRLNEYEVSEICKRYTDGGRVFEIAEELGINYDIVHRVVSERAYTSISKKYLHDVSTTIESTSEDGSE